jgi:hypothetical protein
MTLHTTLFQAVYGRSPPILIKYQGGLSWVQVVDEQLHDRDEFLQQIRERLLLAQDMMRAQHDKKNIGQWSSTKVSGYK